MYQVTKVFICMVLLSMSLGSCLKIETKSKAEKANDDLQGAWVLETFMINGNTVPSGDEDITMSFLASESFPNEGKMTTLQPGNPATSSDYAITEDATAMRVEGKLNHFLVDDDSLEIWEVSTDEFGREVKLELKLRR